MLSNIKLIIFLFLFLLFPFLAFSQSSTNNCSGIYFFNPNCSTEHKNSLSSLLDRIMGGNFRKPNKVNSEQLNTAQANPANEPIADNTNQITPNNNVSPEPLTNTNDSYPESLLTENTDQNIPYLETETEADFTEDIGKTSSYLDKFKKSPLRGFLRQPIQNYSSSDFKGGDFACKGKNGGTVTGIKGKECQPKSQSGQIEDELFFAVVNAAEFSGAEVNLVSCKRSTAEQAAIYRGKSEGVSVAKPGQSKHEIGEALDVTIKGTDEQKTKFILAVLANTDKFNSIGNYPKDSHTHIGSDKNGLWTSFGGPITNYKNAAYLKAETAHFIKNKTKKEVSDAAKKNCSL